MNKVTFMKIQHNLTAVALVSGFIGIWLGLDAYYLTTENDLSEIGYSLVPVVVGIAFSISTLAILAKTVAYLRR